MFYNNHYLCHRKQIILTTMPHFLPAIFAFLFWGKTTAESEDRTRHSSWMRTLVFLVLTICVGLIYVKTLEILYLTNYIDVRAAKAVNKENGKNQITITIQNQLNNDDKNPSEIVKNELLYNKRGNTDEKSSVYDDNIGNSRGSWTIVGFLLSNDTSFILQDYVSAKTHYRPAPDVPWNNALYSEHGYEFSGIFNIDSLCSLITEPASWSKKPRRIIHLKGQGRKIVTSHTSVQKYFCIIYQKAVPDFLPFRLLQTNYHKDDKTGNPHVKSRLFFSANTPWTSIHPREIFGDDGFIQFSGIIHERVGNESCAPTDISLSTSHFNRLGYLTAGDISQGILQLQLHSDIQVSDIYLNFRTPVEFVQLPFTPDAISPYGFHISDSTTISQIIDKDLRLYLKFPALANKQLVRSLILTTLLTALASLFLTNLYFCLRRWIRIYLGKEEEPRKAGKKTRRARICHNILITAVLAVLLFFTFRLFYGNYIYCSLSFRIWGWVITIAAVALFFAIEYLLYRYAKSEMPTPPSSQD